MHPRSNPLGQALARIKSAHFLTDEHLADMARSRGLRCAGATIQKVCTGEAETMGFDKVQAIAASLLQRFGDVTLAEMLAPGMTISAPEAVTTNGEIEDKAANMAHMLGMAIWAWEQGDMPAVRRFAGRMRCAVLAIDAEAVRRMSPAPAFFPEPVRVKKKKALPMVGRAA